MDWTGVLAAEAENPRARLAAEILASPAYAGTAERVKAFVARGEGAGRPSTTIVADSSMGRDAGLAKSGTRRARKGFEKKRSSVLTPHAEIGDDLPS